MFLLYGRMTAKITKHPDPIIACPNDNRHMLNVVIHQLYFHVFFIPFFPAGPTEVFVKCSICEKTYRNKKVTAAYSKVKHFWYLFTGLFLVVLFFLAVGIAKLFF
ncbi:hypothetical protein [Chitinophaga sp. Cy-1792]|uniref:hypothetical protein n=1 Tax=Chitinophaga sp. Cy-1792 TaxID=2608339 RepID=UPI001422498A|nr:hypothetical protein [Chitinophaga sp. Cy-1792]NIG53565.1 hypothetical protein [Chitinophaga sp. Cy-1792]